MVTGLPGGVIIARSLEQFRKEGVFAPAPSTELEKEREGMLEKVVAPLLIGEHFSGNVIYALRKKLGMGGIDWIERKEAGERFKEISPSHALGVSTPETKLFTSRGLYSLALDIGLDLTSYIGVGLIGKIGKVPKAIRVGAKGTEAEKVIGEVGIEYIQKKVAGGTDPKTAQRMVIEAIERGRTDYLAARKYVEPSLHIFGQKLVYTSPYLRMMKKAWDVLPYADKRAKGVDVLKTAFVPYHKIIRDVGDAAKKPFQRFYRRTAADTATAGKHIEKLFVDTPESAKEEIVLALEKGIEPTSPEAKEAVIEIRKLYDEAFEQQVSLGMIKPEQYQELYMHHAATEEGRDWLKKQLGSEYERGLDIAAYRKKLGSAESRMMEGSVYEVNKRMFEAYGIKEFFVEDPYLATQMFAVQHVKATQSHILHRDVMEDYGRAIEDVAPATGRSTAKHDPADVKHRLAEFDAKTQELVDENARKITEFDEATHKITEKRDADVLEFDTKTEHLRDKFKTSEIVRTQSISDKAKKLAAESRIPLADISSVKQSRLEEFDKATKIISDEKHVKYLAEAEGRLVKAQQAWDAKKLVSKSDIATAETKMFVAKGKADELSELQRTFELYHPVSFGEVRHPPTVAEATRGLSEAQVAKYTQDRNRIETLLGTVESEAVGTPAYIEAVSGIDKIMGRYTNIISGKSSAAETRVLTAAGKYKRFEEIGVGGTKPSMYWETKEHDYLSAIGVAEHDVKNLPAFEDWYTSRLDTRNALFEKLSIAEDAERIRITSEIEKLDADSAAAYKTYMELPTLEKWDADRAIKRDEFVTGVLEREGVQLGDRAPSRAILEERIGKTEIDRLEKRGKLGDRLAEMDVRAPPKTVKIDGIEHKLFNYKGDETYLPTVMVEELKRTRPATGFWTEVYDPTLGSLKKTWISIWPGFYSRNVYGGVGWQNILAGVDPDDYARNIDILYGDPTKIHDHNVYGQTGFVGEPSSYITGLGTLGRAYKKYPEQAMHLTENQLRGPVFWHYLSETGDPEFAAEMVYKFHFEYLRGAYTPFEEDVLKRVIPFYSWIRGNMPLQTEMAVRQPGKYAALVKAREMATTPEEYNQLSPWQKEKIIYVHKGTAISIDLPATDLPGLYGRDEAYFGLTPFVKWGMRMLEGKDEYGRKMKPLTTWEGLEQHVDMTAMTFAGRYVYAYREGKKTYEGERPLSHTVAHQVLGVGVHELKESYEKTEESFEAAKYTKPAPTKREKALAWAEQGRIAGAQVFALPLPEDVDDRRWRAVGTMPIEVNEQTVNRVIEKLEGGGESGLYRLRGFGTLVSATPEEKAYLEGFKPTDEQLQILADVDKLSTIEKDAMTPENIEQLGTAIDILSETHVIEDLTQEDVTVRNVWIAMGMKVKREYESRLYQREPFTDEERMAAVARRPSGMSDLRFKEFRYESGEKAGILALSPEEYEDYSGFAFSEAQKKWMFREAAVELPEEAYKEYMKPFDEMKVEEHPMYEQFSDEFYAKSVQDLHEKVAAGEIEEITPEMMEEAQMGAQQSARQKIYDTMWGEQFKDAFPEIYEKRMAEGDPLTVKMLRAPQMKIWKEKHEAEREAKRVEDEKLQEELTELREDPIGKTRSQKGVSILLTDMQARQNIGVRRDRMEELENLLGVGVDR
jgi:hypothetical protein